MTRFVSARARRDLLFSIIGAFVSVAVVGCSGERFGGLSDASSGGSGTGGVGLASGSGGVVGGSGGSADGSGGALAGTGGEGFGDAPVAGSGGAGGDGGTVPAPDASGGDAAMDGDAGKDGPAADAPPLSAPPATWTEHWFEHDQMLDRVAYNDDVAVYFDQDVPRTGTEWIFPRVSNAWKYTRQTYGEFRSATSDGRFYFIFHQGRYGGCHPESYNNVSHDYRNVSDCGAGPWLTPVYGGWPVMVAYVIQFNSNGVSGFPLVNIFSGGRFLEFYEYDVAMALGDTADAAAMYNTFVNNTDTLPQAGSHWFRDWFFPLWRDHGHGQVMARFFKLLSQYFPTAGGRYSRNMNFGEFVHFMSGAAGTDLKAQALTAFGANHPSDAELAKARTDFPRITY